jgi:putative hydrolase of the HAD superfamily
VSLGPPAAPVAPQQLIVRLRRHARPLTPISTGRHPRLSPLRGIRVLLFDVYGTLFLSASGEISSSEAKSRSQALGDALEAMGIPVDRNTAKQAAAELVEAISASHRRLKNRKIEYPEVDIRNMLAEVLAHLDARRSGPGRRDRAFREALAVEYECRSNPAWPMPGLAPTLRRLKDRQLSLGIVSNAQFFTPLLFPALLGQSLESLGFDEDLCVWSYRLLEAKPSGRLFQRILDTLSRRGIGPQEVLHVGNDRLNDIWPAAGVGMRTALFAGDSRSFRPRKGDSRLDEVREDILLTDLSQLTEVVC